MITETKLKAVIFGIKVKLRRGEELEDILASYVKLTDDEKEYIRNALK